MKQIEAGKQYLLERKKAGKTTLQLSIRNHYDSKIYTMEYDIVVEGEEENETVVVKPLEVSQEEITVYA